MENLRIAQKVEAVTAGGKLSTEKLIQHYESWVKGGGYDQDMTALGFAGPARTAEYIASYFPNNQEDVAILDVAAGTGNVGNELLKQGFVQIDALDPCGGMLDAARDRNIYKEYICAQVDGAQLDIPEGTYDAVTCVGGIAEGHLPAASVIEMVRLIKTGGIIVLTGNAGVWRELPEYSIKMAAIIKRLQQCGKLTVLREDVYENYRLSQERSRTKGITIVMKKL